MNKNFHSNDNLLKLLTWLSPSFPVGAYSYSHGIEFAVEEKIVTDVANAFQPTTEMAVESRAQGAAFIDAISAAWPSEQLTNVFAHLNKNTDYIPYPVAVGIVSAIHLVSLSDALSAYLNAFSMNLVSAGVRLIPLGQTEGLKIIAALAESIIEVQKTGLRSSLEDLAATSLLVDWTSACHELQHTRLFRS